MCMTCSLVWFFWVTPHVYDLLLSLALLGDGHVYELFLSLALLGMAHVYDLLLSLVLLGDAPCV